jgi:hypothetical protein
MALQLSVGLRTAILDEIENYIGLLPLIRFFTGAMPADCATADAGTKLAEFALPADWMNDAATGSKTLKGTWQGTAIATGTVGYFRIYLGDGSVCHIQGTITLAGDGGDMIFDSLTITTGQTVTVASFQLNAGNS